jgi:secreted trypsin-like serine protease
MTDFKRIKQLLEGMEQQITELADEIANLEQEQGATQPSRSRNFAAATVSSSSSMSDLPVILPTPQEDIQKIVGGVLTQDFPDCCAVGDSLQYFCSGTLIAPNIVVTARHCTSSTQVFIGGGDVRQPASGETIRIKQEFAHPSADIRVFVLEHDSTITARRVARGAEIDKAQEGIVVGFGTINLAGTIGFGRKRMVRVPIVSLSCSLPTDQDRFGCQPGIELVAGHRGLRKDTCHGDSGGPLYIENANGDILLLGATSRGARNAVNECGDGGIYVRVDQFLDWIQQQTGVQI